MRVVPKKLFMAIATGVFGPLWPDFHYVSLSGLEDQAVTSQEKMRNAKLL